MNASRVFQHPRLVFFACGPRSVTMSHKTPRTEKSIGRIDLTNHCPNCKRTFLPGEAYSVHIRAPGAIVWRCPHCKLTSRGLAPAEDARPPVITDLVVTAEDGLTTCTIVYPNGVRLLYRDTEDGQIRRDVIASTGETRDSMVIGSHGQENVDVDVFTAYATAIKRYCERTESGLRRAMPHLAAALLDTREQEL